MILFLNAICLAAIVYYVWQYFGFIGFNLTKFERPSTLNRLWNSLLVVGFPLIALSFSMEQKQKQVLVGIGISTILSSAIIPDIERNEAGSSIKWVYFRTVGKCIADFLGTAVVYFILLVCWAFGTYWVAAYAGIAIALAIGRCMWIRVQGDRYPYEAAPSLRGLFMVFFGTFSWILILTTEIRLNRHELQSEIKELYQPILLPILGSWVLARFPRLACARASLLKTIG